MINGRIRYAVMKKESGIMAKIIGAIVALILLIFGGSEVVTNLPENQSQSVSDTSITVEDGYVLTFRNENLLSEHYEKHGASMGFTSAEDYEKAAAAVVVNPKALHKQEKEDGDDIYYVEATNEYVVVSQDGYLRTYYKPTRGIEYFNDK